MDEVQARITLYKYLMLMSVKVNIYSRGERCDCSILRAGRRVRWNNISFTK